MPPGAGASTASVGIDSCTAIDTATELLAYYVEQATKVSARVRTLVAERGEAAVLRAETAKLVTDVPVPVHLRPEMGYSSKPGPAGRLITSFKRMTEKMVHHVVEDALDRVSQRLTRTHRDHEPTEQTQPAPIIAQSHSQLFEKGSGRNPHEFHRLPIV